MKGADDLAAFVTAVLRRSGAVVEPHARGFEALLPEELSSRLGLPEVVLLSPEPREGEAALRLAYDEPLVERVGDLLGDEGRFTSLASEGDPPKRERLEKEAAASLPVANASVRLREVLPEEGSYLVARFGLVLRADDRREAMIAVALNEEHPGASPALAAAAEEDPERGGHTLWAGIPPGAACPLKPSAYALLQAVARNEARRAVAPWVAALDRQLARDLRRLRDYYGALLR